MCGFFGMVSFRDDVNKFNDFLQYALNDLSRRGPDQTGVWKDENVLLGFRRLAIRDLSNAGDQPMVSHSRKYVIVYNGEIYNINQLLSWAAIDSLQLKGHSDTEVLLLCFEKMGIKETLERLDGIFAFALYNVENKTITLARDHAGIKPLYYGCTSEGIVFSSHYHLVTAHPYFSDNKIEAGALSNYFKYGFIQEGEGLVTETYNFPHGHFTILSKEHPGEWTPFVNPCGLYETGNGVANNDELHNTFEKIVESQLISDVPVGSFLSGGVDSTLTSAFAHEYKKDITAFTIGVSDPALDETSEAARFAGYFNLNHVIETIDEDEIIALMDDYDMSLAEPLADYSSLMTLKVCELAKKQFTVSLSGDGGDELFWGYPRFRDAAYYVSFFNSSQFGKFLKIIISRAIGKKIPLRLLKYKNFKEYYISRQGIPGSEYWIGKLIPGFANAKKPLLARLIEREVETTNSAMLYAREAEYHIHMQRVLLKVDRASMYHSLEVRTPLLSRRMIEISTKYRYNDCVDNTKAKLPLRNLLISLLPPGEPESGPKKGFSPPLANWLRGTLKNRFEKRLLSIPEIFADYIDAHCIQRIWKEHQSGEKDWAWIIWSIYSLFTWADQKMFKKYV